MTRCSTGSRLIDFYHDTFCFLTCGVQVVAVISVIVFVDLVEYKQVTGILTVGGRR